jgi:hypothetical protein
MYCNGRRNGARRPSETALLRVSVRYCIDVVLSHAEEASEHAEERTLKEARADAAAAFVLTKHRGRGRVLGATNGKV